MVARIALPLVLLVALACRGTPEEGQEKPRGDAFVDLAGAKHHPLEVGQSRAVVLLFTTHDCPIANYYASEINSIIKDHADKPVRFYLVHVDQDLTAEEALKHAKAYGFSCPVLIDSSHRLVHATGATVTPEAAVVGPDGKVLYRGRIDDIYPELGKRRVAPTRRDLREALAAVLAGQPVREPTTQAIGCYIPELRAKN